MDSYTCAPLLGMSGPAKNPKQNSVYNYSCDTGLLYTPESAICSYDSSKSSEGGVDGASDEESESISKAQSWSEKWADIKSKNSDIKYKEFSHLAQDFEYSAQIYSKIIISELYIPDQDKTIKPNARQVGIAGGKKYEIMGILFKVALDYFSLYGSDEKSMKVAGHELRGLMSILSCGIQEINVPLMSLIDYRGYRIIALSLVPINGTNTLVYGTADAGITVHNKDPQLSVLMTRMGQFLNLTPHKVNGINIALCADCEGHTGYDGRFYLLDFARIMPPEYPTNSVKSIFYELLRPELVQSNLTSLNSDSLTGFLKEDSNQKNDNISCMEATKRLYEIVIKDLATQLDKIGHKQEIVIKNELHNMGVNIRHLGRVRSLCVNPHIRSLLLSEMIVRVLKEELKSELRTAVKRSHGHIWYFNKTIEFLNYRFSTQKDLYWSNGELLKSLIIQKFGRGGINVLSKEEMNEKYMLYTTLDLKKLLKYFQLITGVELKEVSTSILALGDSLLLSDLVDLSTRVKSMNIVSEAKAMELVQLAVEASGSEIYRLLELSHYHFEESASRFPSSWSTYRNWGNALKSFATSELHPITIYLILTIAKDKLIRAYELRKRSFPNEDYFLNYDIIFVCIQLSINERMVKLKVPSFPVIDALALARPFSLFFQKLSDPTHSIFNIVRDDILKYGFFYLCCFVNICYQSFDKEILKDIVQLFFKVGVFNNYTNASQSEITTNCTQESLDVSNMMILNNSNPHRPNVNINVVPFQDLDHNKQYQMNIPLCDSLTLVDDVVKILEFIPSLSSLRIYFSENQYPNLSHIFSYLMNSSNLQSVHLVQLHSLSNFSMTSKINLPATLTKLHILCSSITDEIALMLLANATNLTDIDFSGCHFLTNDSIKACSLKKSLTNLSLSHYRDEYYKNEYRMSASLSEKVDIFSHSLTELDLSGLIGLSPENFSNIIHACPNLIKLFAPHKKEILGDGYSISLFSKLTHLRVLGTDLKMKRNFREEEIKNMEIFASLVPLEIYKHCNIANYYYLPMLQYMTSLKNLTVTEWDDKEARTQEQNKSSKNHSKPDVSCWVEFEEWWLKSEAAYISGHKNNSNSNISTTKGKEEKGKNKSRSKPLKSTKVSSKNISTPNLSHPILPPTLRNNNNINNNTMNSNNKTTSETANSSSSNTDNMNPPSRPLTSHSFRTFQFSTMKLDECSINNSQFTILIENSPHLSRIFLRKCFVLTATSLTLLSNNNLTCLEFQDTPFASDECVSTIIKGISQRDPYRLEKIKFQSQRENPKLMCNAIGKYCLNLKSLIFSESKITEEVLQDLFLSVNMNSLRYLEINQCMSLTKEFVNRSLRYNSSRLRIVGHWTPTDCTSVITKLLGL